MRTYLLLGSNVGERLGNLKTALNLIDDEIAPVIERSSVYETKPWGNENQPSFLNQVIVIETQVEPAVLLKKLKSVERTVGRKRTDKWGPRVIDIDILLMDDLIYKSEKLSIPHPQLHKRRFTLVPLAEIAAKDIHPEFELTIQELLSVCKDELEVHVFSSPLPRPSSLS